MSLLENFVKQTSYTKIKKNMNGKSIRKWTDVQREKRQYLKSQIQIFKGKN